MEKLENLIQNHQVSHENSKYESPSQPLEKVEKKSSIQNKENNGENYKETQPNVEDENTDKQITEEEQKNQIKKIGFMISYHAAMLAKNSTNETPSEPLEKEEKKYSKANEENDDDIKNKQINEEKQKNQIKQIGFMISHHAATIAKPNNLKTLDGNEGMGRNTQWREEKFYHDSRS